MECACCRDLYEEDELAMDLVTGEQRCDFCDMLHAVLHSKMTPVQRGMIREAIARAAL